MVSAKHALLGLLLGQRAYRYQLGDRLEERLGPGWKLNSGQLYRTCQRLEHDGLIQRVDTAKDDQDERHIFSATVAGAEDYDGWFRERTSRPRIVRRPLLAKITLAGPGRLVDTLEEIDRCEQECVAELREYLHRRDAIPLGGLRVRADHVLLRLNLSADILHLEAELNVIRLAREQVTWLLSQNAVWPPSQESRLLPPVDARSG